MSTGAAHRVVIIAAGAGTRLRSETGGAPKTLLPLGDGTLLSTLMGSFLQAGLSEFVVVVGYRKGEVTEYLEGDPVPGARVVVVENAEWRRGNGLSVLAAREVVGDGPFLLTMSDHLVSPSALRRLRGSDSAGNLLLVDPWPERTFDLDDATKVEVEGTRITAIGKELTRYNALDCGVFRLDGRFFRTMEEAAARGEESISAGIRGLIADGIMEGLPMTRDEGWADLDSAEALADALRRGVPGSLLPGDGVP